MRVSVSNFWELQGTSLQRTTMFGGKNSKSKQGAGDPGAWTVYDRIEEVRGKLTLKRRDQEAYYTFSQQKISENEELITALRAEIKEKQIQQKRSLNADEYVIREGFCNNRESQLAMQRYTVEKAIMEKNEHVFDKVGQLNMARHEKHLRKNKVERLLLTLRDLKCAARTKDENKSSQRVRILTTSLDKMKMKCGSARFIQKTYKQILYHLERDSLTLPGRLNQLESSLQSVKNELNNELLHIQTDAKNAYEQTKVEKEQLDSRIMKLKRARDSTLAQTRRRFKKLSQEGQDKESKPRKRHLNRAGGDYAETKRRETKGRLFWEEVRAFWILKKTMDKLRENMCVGEPANIAAAFQLQIQRHNEMEKMVEILDGKKKTMSMALGDLRMELSKIEQSCQEAIEETNRIATRKRNCTEEVLGKMNETTDRLRKAEQTLFEASCAVDQMRNKVAACDWVAKQVKERKVQMLVEDNTHLEKLDPHKNILETFHMVGENIHSLNILIESNKVTPEDSEQFRELFSSNSSQELLAEMTDCCPHNKRIVIDEDEDTLPTEDFFCDDDDDNDEYLSRDTIKAMFEQLSDSANVRKRRKRQKGKK